MQKCFVVMMCTMMMSMTLGGGNKASFDKFWEQREEMKKTKNLPPNNADKNLPSKNAFTRYDDEIEGLFLLVRPGKPNSAEGKSGYCFRIGTMWVMILQNGEMIALTRQIDRDLAHAIYVAF